jgi:hypothetical protein
MLPNPQIFDPVTDLWAGFWIDFRGAEQVKILGQIAGLRETTPQAGEGPGSDD